MFVSTKGSQEFSTQRKSGWEINKPHSSQDQKLVILGVMSAYLGKCLCPDALRELGHIWE